MVQPYESVNQEIVSMFPCVVEELGGDPSDFLRRVGLSPQSFMNGEVRATYRQVVKLLAFAASELRCGEFGLRMARAQAGTIHSPLMRVIENARTLGEALRLVCTHSYAHSTAVAIWLDEMRSDETVVYGLDILLEDLPNRSQAMEQILLIAYSSIREATGARVRARSISFRHEQISETEVYRRYFGCEVHFGQQADAIFFDAGDLACPIFCRDDDGVQAALAAIGQRFPHHETPAHATVRGIMMKLIGPERCGIGDVASTMGCSTKKLSRMLAEENTTFQKIKNKLRLEMIRYYVEDTDLDFTTVSERAGFSEQSALTHFCGKWLKASPSTLRSRARGGPHQRYVQRAERIVGRTVRNEEVGLRNKCRH